jgi:hypothetical protein
VVGRFSWWAAAAVATDSTNDVVDREMIRSTMYRYGQ